MIVQVCNHYDGGDNAVLIDDCLKGDSGCWIGLISLVGLRGWRIRLCTRVSTENRVRKFDKISDNGPEGNLG